MHAFAGRSEFSFGFAGRRSNQAGEVPRFLRRLIRTAIGDDEEKNNGAKAATDTVQESEAKYIKWTSFTFHRSDPRSLAMQVPFYQPRQTGQ